LCATLVGEVTDDDSFLRVPWGETIAESHAFAGHLESKANQAFAFDKRIILQIDIGLVDIKSMGDFSAGLMQDVAQKKTHDIKSRVLVSTKNDGDDQRGAITIRAVMLG
jgi:hypothetical protein